MTDWLNKFIQGAICTLAKVIKGGGLLLFSKNFPILSWTKICEISIDLAENIDEVEQISFLSTCTTN